MFGTFVRLSTSDGSTTTEPLIDFPIVLFASLANKISTGHPEVDARPPLQPFKQLRLGDPWRNALRLTQQKLGHTQALRCRASFQLLVPVLGYLQNLSCREENVASLRNRCQPAPELRRFSGRAYSMNSMRAV
jgi:hypothetical protein